MIREINFDGIVGPTHNHAGLSLGNLAATRNAGLVAYPREAALQGLAKMRVALDLGLAQGVLLPHDRPNRAWLASLGATMAGADPVLAANAMSAAAMWAANAATVSPAADTADRRCHMTVANLVTMLHRSQEWPGTLAQLRLAFADTRHFAVHGPVPSPLGDEGAANHLRLSAGHDAPGVEVFVYGMGGGPFPARQHRMASEAVARLHGLDPERTVFAEQSPEAIAAGAFHNDVVAVANEAVLLAHELAFADREAVHARLHALVSGLVIEEAPAATIPLADAVKSYLFNAQLVSLPEGGMALILPSEARNMPNVWQWLEGLTRKNGPIRQLIPVELRQSMNNGGGPACLRLRVTADPATIDPRFLVDHARLELIEGAVLRHWPEAIAVDELRDPLLLRDVTRARCALLDALDLAELI